MSNFVQCFSKTQGRIKSVSFYQDVKKASFCLTLHHPHRWFEKNISSKNKILFSFFIYDVVGQVLILTNYCFQFYLDKLGHIIILSMVITIFVSDQPCTCKTYNIKTLESNTHIQFFIFFGIKQFSPRHV